MVEIDMFSVTLGQTGKNTENLGGALGSQDGKGAGKFAGVKPAGGGANAAIAVKDFIGLPEVDIDAGILQHRYKVIGRVPHHAILFVNDANAAKASLTHRI